MDLIDLEDETIDAEVMDSLAVSMDNFRVCQGLVSVRVVVMYLVVYYLSRSSIASSSSPPPLI